MGGDGKAGGRPAPPHTHTDTHDSYSNALPTEWDGGLQATGMSLPIPSAWRPSPPARGAVGPGLAARPSQASAARAHPGANKGASRGCWLGLHGARPRPHNLPAWGCRAGSTGLSTGAVPGVDRDTALPTNTGLAGQSPTRSHPGEHPVAVGGCSPSPRGPHGPILHALCRAECPHAAARPHRAPGPCSRSYLCTWGRRAGQVAVPSGGCEQSRHGPAALGRLFLEEGGQRLSPPPCAVPGREGPACAEVQQGEAQAGCQAAVAHARHSRARSRGTVGTCHGCDSPCSAWAPHAYTGRVSRSTTRALGRHAAPRLPARQTLPRRCCRALSQPHSPHARRRCLGSPRLLEPNEVLAVTQRLLLVKAEGRKRTRVLAPRPCSGCTPLSREAGR